MLMESSHVHETYFRSMWHAVIHKTASGGTFSHLSLLLLSSAPPSWLIGVSHRTLKLFLIIFQLEEVGIWVVFNNFCQLILACLLKQFTGVVEIIFFGPVELQ